MDPPLHSDFRYGRIRTMVPLQRAGDLLSRNEEGSTCLHLAATCGGFEFIPSELLCSETLLQRDKNGDTPLHLAAFTGRLKDLPLSSLDASVFEQKDGDGLTVFDIAREKRHLDQLPGELLHCFPFYQREVIVGLMKKGSLEGIPSGLRSPDLWAEASNEIEENGTLYHEAARLGYLDLLPQETLRADCWMLRDLRGRTPVHLVATHGASNSLARLVAKTGKELPWDQTDLNQNTVLHSAAKGCQLSAVPADLFDQKHLAQCNRDNENVVDLAYRYKCLDAVPEHLRFLSEQYARERIRHALTTGNGEGIPPVYFTKKSLDVLLPEVGGDSSGLQLVHKHGTYHLLAPELLAEIVQAAIAGSGTNPLHAAAAAGMLDQLPRHLLTPELLRHLDQSGKTPLHLAIARGFLWQIPTEILNPDLLTTRDANGVSGFHLAAALSGLGSVPAEWFTRDVLLTKDTAQRSVADVIWEHGHTEHLPVDLRELSGRALISKFKTDLQTCYTEAARFAHEYDETLLSRSELSEAMRHFVQEWSNGNGDIKLDDEQASAVAEFGCHIQVTARAGSGKTRTLVARALFQITHCGIPASSILILAFNKKAVEEIRERLSKVLSEEQMPHVLTFHALAYRIVKPAEDLIFDEGETKESQVFSTTIQRIIDEGMRVGTLEGKLRELMEARWSADLKRIISLGFNLPQEEFLAHRANLPVTTMNARRVDTEAHKHIGNALLRLGLRYSYRRGIHRAAGTAYAPDFSHYHKETDQRFLIEVLGEDAAQANAARQAFWNSDRSTNAHLMQFPEADCLDPDAVLERVARELSIRGIAVSPMSDDELWLALRDDAIRDFTKAVKNFISRCQKELISPARLEGMLPDTDPELWVLRSIGENRYIKEPTVDGMQVRFWRLCSWIYRQYRQVLTESHQTDFDQLMLDSAVMIREGRTGFKSERGSGDICQIRHLLIDEYQDFSHLFDELRKSIIAQSPDANFFCVGDDWQAINKFAGSDLRYFTGFTETFEPSVRKLITRNYRSCRRIVEIGNQVMHGQGEPSIPNSSDQGNVWRVEVGGYSNLTEAEETVVEELGDDALAILRIASDCTSRGESVAILSRTSSVATPEGMHKLERWQEKLRSFLPEKNRELLETSTTHGYKGKEADVVILLDPEAYPFVHPDSIFSTIFGDTLQSIQDDEKRLFYVGVTRPKKTLYLISYPSRYSDMRPYVIRFLEGNYPPPFDINRLQSNLLCGGRVVVRLVNLPHTFGSGGTFPLKDRLKVLGYKWNEENKSWSMALEEGSISSPFECVQYLNAQPWIGDADGVVASFAWGDQRHQFHIHGGRVGTGPAIPSTDAASVQMSGHWHPVSGSAGESSPKAERWPAAKDATAPQAFAEFPPGSSAASLPTVPGTEVHHTRVAGVTYDNRAPAIRRLRIDEAVMLMRRPNNPKDPNAIEVVSVRSESLGYIPATLAARLARRVDALGGQLQAIVTEMHPGEANGSYLSLAIRFELPGPSGAGSSPQLLVPSSQPSPAAPQPHASSSPASGSLTAAQDNELALLGDPRLRLIITELYLSGSCPWPVIGYEGQDSKRHCTDSMLEVAWPDQKIGIYLPTNNVTTFAATGWVILPTAAVSVEMLRSILSSASGQVITHQKPTPPPPQSPGQSPPETIDEDDIPF
jgi:DNA helicase IV